MAVETARPPSFGRPPHAPSESAINSPPTAPSDAVLLAVDSHPNIEVRMFNPVVLRSPRLLGMIADLGRINRRMHNNPLLPTGK